MEKAKILYRSFLSRTILFSIFYNLIWFAVFFVFLRYFSFSPMLVVIGFLIVYLFLAQPLKDFFFLYLYKRFVYRNRSKNTYIENEISRIHTQADIEIFLSNLVKFWKLNALLYSYFFPTPQMLYITAQGKARSIKAKKSENPLFIQFLRKSPLLIAIDSFPLEVQKELGAIEINTVAPILYRQKLFGYLAFRDSLQSLDAKIISLVTQRIGLTFANEFWRQKVPGYKAMEQEFDTANRVEKLLQMQAGKNIYGYSVGYNVSAWDDKYFPALLDLRIPEKDSKNQNGFAILARLNNIATRSKSLQLFIVQGYFYSLAQTSPSLEVLVNSLHELLRDRENGKILLDGFLLEISPDRKIRIQSFGSKLSMAIDEDLFFVLPYPSLGKAGTFVCKPQVIASCRQLDLNIQKYTLAQFKKSEHKQQ